MNKFFLVLLLIVRVTTVFAQAPNISYPGPQVLPMGETVSIFPANTGGPIAAPGKYRVTTFAGTGAAGSANGTTLTASFDKPRAITADPTGNIYIIDNNNYIRKIATDGTVSVFAGSGAVGSTDGIGIAASFTSPQCITTDATGNVYVGESRRVRKITPAGQVSTIAGSGAYSSINGVGTAASFKTVSGIAVDISGNIYVAEEDNNTIRKITTTGIVLPYAGTGEAGLLNLGTTLSKFNAPKGLAIDASGNLYIADAGNKMIRKIIGQTVLTYAGSGSNGSDDGLGLSSKFSEPTDLAIDPFGNLMVTENNGSTIRKIIPQTPLTGYATTIAGTYLTPGATNGVGTANSSFNSPYSIAINSLGTIFIADRNNDLIRSVQYNGYQITPTLPAGLEFDEDIGKISGVPTVISAAKNYMVVAANGNGATSTILNVETSAPVSLPNITSFTPTSASAGTTIIISGQNLYGVTGVTIGGVTTSFYTPSTISIGASNSGVYTRTSPIILTAIIPPGATSGNVTVTNNVGTVSLPGFTYSEPQIPASSGDHIYTLNTPITPLSPTNNIGTTSSAYNEVATVAGTASLGNFYYLTGSVVDASGNIFAIDRGTSFIKKITPAGVVTTFAGSISGYADGPALSARFFSPLGIAIDKQGNIYIADANNNRIRKITTAGQVSTLAGNGTAGATNGTGINATFNKPCGLTVDVLGNVYVADNANNLIRKITPNGTVSTFAGLTGPKPSFVLPTGITIDKAGDLYVTDDQVISKITPAGVISVIAGMNISQQGYTPFAAFNSPSSITLDDLNNIYIADTKNNVIKIISALGKVSVLAGKLPPLFTPTNTINNGIGGLARINQPTSVTYDGRGALIITEANNDIIRKIALTGYSIDRALPAGLIFDGTTGSISGTPTVSSPLTTYIISAYTTTGVTTSAVKIAVGNPPGITYTSPQIFTVATAITPLSPSNTGDAVPANTYGKVTLLAGKTTASFANGDGNTAGFNHPVGLATDAFGNILLADQGNHSIRKITPLGSVTTVAGNGVPAYNDGIGISAQFFNPTGVAIGPLGNLYVSDKTSQTIRMITPTGTVTLFTGVPGVSGAVNGNFNLPTGITLDYQGNILVTEEGNNVIRKIENGYTSTIAGNSGGAGYLDGLNTATMFNSPSSLVSDIMGYMYVADKGNRIRKISPIGEVTTFAGSGTAASIDGTGVSAGFNQPTGIAIDAPGNLYVTDAGSNMIRKITPAGVVTTLAGSTTSGATDGVGTAATFSQLSGIVNDNLGNIYVSDNNMIRKVTVTGYTISPALPAGLNFDGKTGIITGIPATVFPRTDYTITAYNASGSSTTNLSLSTGNPQTISFEPLGTVTYGSADVPLNAISTSNLSISYSSSDPTIATIVNNKVHIIRAGNVVITALQAGNNTYGATTATQTIIINPATLSIKADNKSKAYGDVNPVFTATYTGFVNGDDVTKLTIPVAFSTNANTLSQAGSYVITASGAASANYIITYVNGTIIINPFALPLNNFQLTNTSVTCKGAANGQINITALQNFNYTATITGNTLNSSQAFTNSAQINNLTAGTYNICIAVAGQPDYKQCFTSIITEPKDLSVYTAVVQTNKVTLSLDGASVYYININGRSYNTSDTHITLPLSKGSNSIVITTDKVCQGQVEKTINVAQDIKAYPNPFQDVLNLNLGNNNIKSAIINIYTVFGKVVYSANFTNKSGVVPINLTELEKSTYVIKLSADNTDTVFKIIKK